MTMGQPFENHGDVGAVKHAGAMAYDVASQRFTISGAGTNMWGPSDEFHFAWKRLKGDFLVTMRAAFVGKGVDPHRKFGWTARPTVDTASPHATAVVHGDGLTSLQFRRTPGAATEEIRSAASAPNVVQLERRGNTFIMSVATFGQPFVVDQIADLDLGEELYVGLFVCSHNPDVVETATFDNVRIVKPTWEGFVPYRDYLGSMLEILDVQTGRRTVVHETTDCIEAPNWTPDGSALIYNSKGRLYRFDLGTGSVSSIDTGFAVKNNNDHVLSFDGTMIGISHHSADHGNKSIVYTLPVGGGTPRQVTTQAPSYLHGWSPDSQWLTYTAERGDGNYDIYKIPATGGEEIRLTTAPGLDDGSEYTPDGRFIYFNSVRSEKMQIWRMKPDGSDQEAVTRDEYNNWFPHISPDGKRIVLLSYGDDVRPNDHPYYKHVTLRMMPITGGAPRIVAYLYGGQGTINVPSWAPDNRRIAFVSNTGPA